MIVDAALVRFNGTVRSVFRADARVGAYSTARTAPRFVANMRGAIRSTFATMRATAMVSALAHINGEVIDQSGRVMSRPFSDRQMSRPLVYRVMSRPATE